MSRCWASLFHWWWLILYFVTPPTEATDFPAELSNIFRRTQKLDTRDSQPSPSSFTPSSAKAAVCNGFAEFCDRSYGNITFVGAHDSFAFSTNPFLLARTQSVDIPTQLSLGVRLLQAQSHFVNGTLHFCHTSCGLFDGGTVSSYLALIKTFLSQNPTEVLTLLFTNPEGASLQTTWEPLFEQAGLHETAYVPSTVPVARGDWPTLGEMIDNGKRLVVFLDYGADAGDGSGRPSFILPEFEMIWENAYGATDPSFPCWIDRISGPLEPSDHMYLLNHVLNNQLIQGVTFSDPADVNVTNGANSIMKNVNGCLTLGAGLAPNFILLDYVHVGDGFKVADELNGVTRQKVTTTTPSPSATSSHKSGSAGRYMRWADEGVVLLSCLLVVLVLDGSRSLL